MPPEQEVVLAHKEYTYPFPVAWTSFDNTFSITGISLHSLPADSKNAILTFSFKIATGGGAMCLPMDMRRIINDEGDLSAPITKSFLFSNHYGGAPSFCPDSNTTYPDQKVEFLVPRNEKSYIFQTGALDFQDLKTPRKEFFTIEVMPNGTIQAAKILHQG